MRVIFINIRNILTVSRVSSRTVNQPSIGRHRDSTAHFNITFIYLKRGKNVAKGEIKLWKKGYNDVFVCTVLYCNIFAAPLRAYNICACVSVWWHKSLSNNGSFSHCQRPFSILLLNCPPRQSHCDKKNAGVDNSVCMTWIADQRFHFNRKQKDG